jgi:hypothetical protein
MNLRTHLLPILAVAGGAGAALFGLGGAKNSAAPPPSEVRAQPPSPPAAPIPDEAIGAPAGKMISGTVLERIDVDKYTYLRLGEPGGRGTWTAVSTAKAQVGERVRVSSAELMTGFTSATLKRTFDEIYFGVLETQGALAAAVGEDPHARARAAGDTADVGKVDRAAGPLGRTIAELYAQRALLEGKPVRVRGVVVKSVGGVLGRTFLHVRDGSGDAQAGDNDLTVTTSATPEVGARVLLEGTAVRDKDYGSGYRYPLILEDARLLPE